MGIMDREAVEFASAQAWNDWLAAHQDASEVWVMYWKKGSGTASIDWQEAVVEALCWGWIDGVRKGVDGARFKQRFTPRRAGSTWSQINKAHVERLTAEGRMRAPGLAAVAAAKANGRWDASYSGGMAKAELPAELAEALAAGPEAARTAWAGLDARNRFAIYHRVTLAKRAQTRVRKAGEYVAMLARGERIY